MHKTQNPQIHPQDFVKCWAWLHDAIIHGAPEPRLSFQAAMLCCHQMSQNVPGPHWIFLMVLGITPVPEHTLQAIVPTSMANSRTEGGACHRDSEMTSQNKCGCNVTTISHEQKYN